MLLEKSTQLCIGCSNALIVCWCPAMLRAFPRALAVLLHTMLTTAPLACLQADVSACLLVRQLGGSHTGKSGAGR